MANLYQDLNQNQNVQQMSFPQFMQMMKGKNPTAILNEMLKSGKITQTQLDEAQQLASRKMGMFEQFKGMFGF